MSIHTIQKKYLKMQWRWAELAKSPPASGYASEWSGYQHREHC